MFMPKEYNYINTNYVDNYSDAGTNDIDVFYNDLGTDIFHADIDNSTLSFYNLGNVHVDYIEMKRETERIDVIGRSAVNQLCALASALCSLASLVGYSIDTSGFDAESLGLDSFPLAIEEGNYSGMSETVAASTGYALSLYDNISNIIHIMNSQINMYQEQANITKEQLLKLNNMVDQVLKNPELTYRNIEGVLCHISYNDLLLEYKKAQLVADYGIASFDDLLVSCDNNNEVNLYSYIENNLQDEMKLVGVSTGKEYLRYILDSAEKGALTNREKAVRGAIALNNFLGDNNITWKYSYGRGHTNFDLNDLSTATDCSSYVSILVKEGNPDFNSGSTGTFLADKDNITTVDINNILPGDILTSYGHARFVLYVDKDNDFVITTENLNSGIGSAVKKYSISDLINTGYFTYHVQYDDVSGDLINSK